MFLDTIKNNCLQYKDRTAYICDGQQLTYRELWSKANSLACYLQKDGDSPVLVYGHKSPYMIVSFLACLISGRTYIPCDVSIPLPRIKSYFEKTKAGIILATEPFQDWWLPISGIEEIKDICSQNLQYQQPFKDDFTAYIIFTSGSSGKPKGVPITMKNLEHFITWITGIPGIKDFKNSVLINQALYSFDLSVADIYLSLINGNTLFATIKKEQENFFTLFNRFYESNGELMVCTPTYMQMCLCDKSFNSLLLPKLRTVLFCGEILPVKVVKKLFERFPDITIINAYGPTEATCAVSAITITKDMLTFKNLPVGTVVNSAVKITIIDKKHKVLPDGKYGEIVLCGDSICDGYLDFVSGSFVEHDGVKCYLTGDIGMKQDGFLYFKCRNDNQIKYRGYRIELSEIETAIQAIKKVNNAVVLPVYGSDGRVNNLTAVVENSEDDISPEEITSKLQKTLPEYMVPKRFEFVSRMPMNKNGKCDRRFLEKFVCND